jgi:hypothetical protein
MRRTIIALGFLCFLGAMIVAQQPEKTREEQLLEQVATLQLQLAQTTDRWAKCEANGPQSAQLQQAGQTTAQALMKSLADRNLTLDKDGKLVPLPSETRK